MTQLASRDLVFMICFLFCRPTTDTAEQTRARVAAAKPRNESLGPDVY